MQFTSSGAMLTRGAAQPRKAGAAAVIATVQVLMATAAVLRGAAQLAMAGLPPMLMRWQLVMR